MGMCHPSQLIYIILFRFLGRFLKSIGSEKLSNLSRVQQQVGTVEQEWPQRLLRLLHARLYAEPSKSYLPAGRCLDKFSQASGIPSTNPADSRRPRPQGQSHDGHSLPYPHVPCLQGWKRHELWQPGLGLQGRRQLGYPRQAPLTGP